MKRFFDGREIEIIDFDDISGDHVIEFRDSSYKVNEAVMAVVIPDGRSWNDAIVSISPRKGDLAASFVLWAISVAEERLR